VRGIGIALLLLVTAACAAAPPARSTPGPGNSPSGVAATSPTAAGGSSPSASPIASAQPTASSTPLFAALEAKGTPLNQWNTVVIAGLDGYARAKATFTPMPTPYVGCAGPVIPSSAHVAAGKVYFADGTGVIRSLSITGQLTQVATFPLTSSQQMLSFAVSPDGGRLLATIFTIPPKAATGDACSGAPAFAPGDFTLAMYYAEPGRSPRPLWNVSWPQGSTSTQVTALIGWDNVGPLATYPTSWATQGGGPIHYWGTPVRLDYVTGKMLGPIADPNACGVWDIASSGDFVCVPLGTGDLSVRRPDGSEIWRVAGQPNSGYELAFLSPDEQHLVALGSGTEVLGRGGSDTKLPDAFQHVGWLDSGTVIGGGFNTNLDYVSLSSPGNVVDIGFKGLFVGTVRN